MNIKPIADLIYIYTASFDGNYMIIELGKIFGYFCIAIFSYMGYGDYVKKLQQDKSEKATPETRFKTYIIAFTISSLLCLFLIAYRIERIIITWLVLMIASFGVISDEFRKDDELKRRNKKSL